uniref:Uncharacterized protein n=1 Tax=Myotis myotis TaxID=51298 RepID=A0A7J7YDI7_MYOMY|nr:hypothetical protein mMyoMyo1_010980 [Myotis myotis]
MLAIQPLSLGSADEKLGTVCVRSSICHGQGARTCMFQDEVLILKFLPIDGLAACATMVCEVTSLAQKSWNNAVKATTFLTKSFLPSAQSMNVFCCLWNFVCKQLEGDTAQELAVHEDVKEYGGVHCGWSRTGRFLGSGICKARSVCFKPFS